MQNLSPRIVVQNAPPQQRVTRSPRHTFNLRHRPFQVQPFFIAPVWPGETLTSVGLQARCKTDPLAGSVDLLGWWLEHYVFYVKLTDLAGRDDFTEMLLSFGHDLSAYNAVAKAADYHAGGGPNWVGLCVDRIVDEYFRDEGDGTVTLDGMHQAQVVGETWFESAKLASQTATEDHDLPGDQLHEVPAYYSGTDFATHYTQWRHMVATKLTDATFEDWVGAFGIKTDTRPPRQDYRPELLMRSKEYQYPSVVVDGATATSTAAVVWSVASSADKRRLFREPGFMVGVTIARPKMYFSKQVGAAVSMMDDAYAWLPAVLKNEPYTSLKKFTRVAVSDGPLGTTPTEDYWVDVRDLAIYGDQFVNWDISATPAGTVALPTSAMVKKYAASAQIDAYFAGATAATRLVRQDGIVTPNVLGMQVDQT